MKNLIFSLRDVLTKMSYILNRKQKIYCAITFVMTMIGVVFETLGISIILPVVQAMLYPSELMKNKWVRVMAELLNLKEEFQLLILVAAAAMLIYIVKNVYLIVLSFVRARFSSRIQRDLGVYMM